MSVEEKKQDYLDTDPPIAGQNFVCLSFVSPDDLIKKREGYQVANFLQSYAKDKGMDFKQVYEDYENYCYKFHEELQRDFDKENKFQTSIRGVKIRGCYSTKEEAERRAQKLQRMDDTFHVFVGDVGAWLPWDPCADNVESEVFADTALQELMQKYKENNANKDIFYEEDKRDRIKKATEENKKAEEKLAEEKLADSENITVEPVQEDSDEKKNCDDSPDNCPDDCPDECPAPDCSLSKQQSTCNVSGTVVDLEPEPDCCCETSCEPEPEPESVSEPEPESVSEPEPEEGSKVDESIKTSLEDMDPWLKDKINKID